jgi:hypothetical protein
VRARPFGSVDPVPFSVAVFPTFTVWFGPAFAVGFCDAEKVQLRLAGLKLYWRFCRIVNESVLVIVVLAGTAPKLTVPLITRVFGLELTTVPTTFCAAAPVLFRSAVYV